LLEDTFAFDGSFDFVFDREWSVPYACFGPFPLPLLLPPLPFVLLLLLLLLLLFADARDRSFGFC
jgi:hypothetical protein